MTNEPKTTSERLDAARSGEDFAQVLSDLFGALEKAIDDEGRDSRD